MFALKEEPTQEESAQEIGSLAEAVLVYVRRHCEAADSLEGIREWWLPSGSFVSLRSLERALDQLVSQGLMQRTRAADGIVLYSGTFKLAPTLNVVS